MDLDFLLQAARPLRGEWHAHGASGASDGLPVQQQLDRKHCRMMRLSKQVKRMEAQVIIIIQIIQWFLCLCLYLCLCCYCLSIGVCFCSMFICDVHVL